MNRDIALSILRAHEAPLRERGVLRAALFGSTARNDNRANSDVDIMVDIDPKAGVDLLSYCGIINLLEDMFPTPVDVAERTRLYPGIRESAERDAIYAF